MELTAYAIGRPAMKIVAASGRRKWMDQTERKFANRCLPMLIANQAGWHLLNHQPIRAIWNGKPDLDAVLVQWLSKESKHEYAHSHFGHGILTFTIPYLFRTPPGVNLLIRGPANTPKDGIGALEGMVETDWSHATATMNWKFTRPLVWVEFRANEPIALLVPQRVDLIEKTRLRERNIAEDPDLMKKYEAWSASRQEFNRKLRSHDAEAARVGWQKDYIRGHDGHRKPRTKLTLKKV